MTTATRRRRPTLSPEEREARIAELKGAFDTAVLTLMNDPAQWVEFLDTVANFAARYSFANQLLILIQAQRRGLIPTMVEPFGDAKGTYGWKKLGRTVMKGEKALHIWRPNKRRWTEEEAAQAQAQGRRVPPRDSQGRFPHKIVGWGIAPVFDISQTEGADVELPTVTVRRRLLASQRPELLTGEDTTGSLAEVVRLIEAQGYRYSRVPFASLDGANGRTTRDGRVLVREDVDDVQAVKTSIHELAHIRCGHLADDYDYLGHQGRAETEAESVAYIVAGSLGLDSEAYSAPYVASWADGNPEVVTQAARTVLTVAKGILEALAAPENDEV